MLTTYKVREGNPRATPRRLSPTSPRTPTTLSDDPVDILPDLPLSSGLPQAPPNVYSCISTIAQPSYARCSSPAYPRLPQDTPSPPRHHFRDCRPLSDVAPRRLGTAHDRPASVVLDCPRRGKDRLHPPGRARGPGAAGQKLQLDSRLHRERQVSRGGDEPVADARD